MEAVGSRKGNVVWVGAILVTLVVVSLQSVGSHLLSPPIRVPDVLGARLVDIVAGDWWRVFAASFVSEFGWPHALLNCVGFALVARPVERQYGSRFAALVFAVSALAAFAAGVAGHGIVWLMAGGSGAVLGFTGVIASRLRQFHAFDRVSAGLVVAATFGPPLVLVPVFHIANRWSTPAHGGGLAAGLVLGAVSTWRLWALAAVATAVTAVAVCVLKAPAYQSRPALLTACGTSIRSNPARVNLRTRVVFVNDAHRPTFVYWINLRGVLAYRASIPMSQSLGRNRLPFYGYAGAAYLVADAAGRCETIVIARAAPSTVVIRRSDSAGTCWASVGGPVQC
jgi:membrane associated rhomboid family serine protease